uniref:Apoptosis enhancing nuclease n=1 Tax=Latimeria chalumnae TaxID=7897 RepID=H3BG52_LATCH
KRRSRKHLRFEEHRAYLEREGLLKRKELAKTKSPPCCPASSEKRNSLRLKTSKTSGSPACSGCSSLGRPVNPNKCVALDCEMVGTGAGGKVSELARCSIVSYHGDVVYDKYVKPKLPVVDYRTRWSGIRKEHLRNAIPFKTAQKEVLQILKGKVVVGHALHNDFKALEYFHPKWLTRDTSKISALNRKAGLPVREVASLKRMAKYLLKRDIQVGREGHSSVEDALASMELYRLVEMEWEEELQKSSPADELLSPSPADSSRENEHYMQDQYWPSDLNEVGQ